MSSHSVKANQKKDLEDTWEYFQDLFSSDLVFLYSDIKKKIDSLALDLLNQETKTHLTDFVNLIFNSVDFEIPSYDENIEEEMIDLSL